MGTSFPRLCLIMLAIGALALAGCGSDGDTGMAGPAGPPGPAGEAAEGPSEEEIAAEVEAAVEAALADQEPAPQVDTSELEAAIDALTETVEGLEEDVAEAAMPAVVGLPTLDDTATALTRNVDALSQMAGTYDVSLVDATLAAGATAAAGDYAGKAMTGFGGLDITDTGADGANVFGSWLSDSHWGLVHTKSGRVAANRVAVFSVGEQTGSNPAPRGGETRATWTGSMVGSWDEDARTATVAEIRAGGDHLITNPLTGARLDRNGMAVNPSADTTNTGIADTVVGTIAIGDPLQGINLPGVNVRGTAILAVEFTQTAGGPTSSADLEIRGLTGNRGRFRPGVTQTNIMDRNTPPAVIANSSHAPDPNSLMVWTDMEIMAGDFARRDFNRFAGPDGSYAGLMVNRPAGAAGSVLNPDGSTYTPTTTVGVTNPGIDDIHDRPGPNNYLAGRFYSSGGSEVGGVFMENGQISGADNAYGTPGDIDNTPDIMGTLIGAFGAARDIP